MSKFIIEVRTAGFSKAHRDFNKLNKSAKDYDNTAGKVRGSTSGMRRQIGALRNNLLLATFAFAGIARGMVGFVRASSGFQDVKTRLTGMFGSVKEATEAFNVFNQIAATTPFMLEDVVNAGAQLEAFGVDSKATLKSVTDLAAYMGSTAVEAANALGRAFAGGAGAADILRDKGILQLVKDSQGIEDLTKITLPQFRQALIASMSDPMGKIAGSADRMSDTWTGAVSNMNDAITRFQATVGDELLPILTETVKSIEKFFRVLDINSLKRWGIELATVAGGYTVYTTYVALATGAQFKFNVALAAAIKLAKAFYIAFIIGTLDAYIKWQMQMDSARKAQKVLGTTVEEANRKLDQYTKEVGDARAAVKEWAEESEKLVQPIRDVLEANNALLKSSAERKLALMAEILLLGQDNEVIKGLIKAKLAGLEVDEEELALLKKLQEEKEKIADADAREKIRLEAEKQAKKDMLEFEKEANEERLALMEAEQQAVSAIADANKNIFADNMEFQMMLIETQADKYLAMKMDEVAVDAWAEQQKLDIVQAHLEKRDAVYNAFMSGYDTFVNSLTDMEMTGKDRREKIWEASKASFVQFLGDLVKEEIKQNAIRSTIAKAGQAETILSAGIVGAAVAAEYSVAASMAATASFGLAAETGLAAIIASVAATKAMAVEPFAEGGDFVTSGPRMILVGDNPGGREHVRINPLSSPPGPNAPSSGGITINISAPLVDETVIDHIIPAIQKAQRMNLA